MSSTKYYLFLDDERMPIGAYTCTGDKSYLSFDWIIVRNYKQFCDTIEAKWNENKSFPELISFDHDLADEHYKIGAKSNFTEFDYSLIKEATGKQCAEWLANFCMDNDISCPDFKVHSMNTCGRDNISSYLENFRRVQQEENEEEE